MKPLGFKKALGLFKSAAKRVPAYRHFLQKHGINPDKIYTYKDFKKIPLTDKKSYILQYPFRDLFFDFKIPPMVYASSGSSGKPTFWFRGDEQELVGGDLHEIIFKDIFDLEKKEPTLVIICFSMGVWVAGNYTLNSCRNLSRKGWNITTITPGTEKEDILNILKELVPHFKQTVLAGYPPFVMDIVNEALNKKIKIKNDIKILTAGDKFSEEWRRTLLNLLRVKDGLGFLVSIYGSADGGILGHETPLTIFLRNSAALNSALHKVLFEGELPLPAFVQYHPNHIFFEEVRGELVFTTQTAMPLIRYNIHDVGRIVNHPDLINLLRNNRWKEKLKSETLKKWTLPTLVLKGRTDVAVTFYALNIFPEHIKAGVEDKTISRFLSGNFLAYNKTTRGGKHQKLYIKLELAPGITLSNKIRGLSEKSILKNLIKLNTEFRKLHSILGKKALPIIIYSRHGKFNFSVGLQGVLQTKGKKPRIVL